MSRNDNQDEKIKPRIQCLTESSLEQGISGHNFDSRQKMKLGPRIKLWCRTVVDLNSIGSINRTGLFIIQGSNVCTKVGCGPVECPQVVRLTTRRAPVDSCGQDQRPTHPNPNHGHWASPCSLLQLHCRLCGRHTIMHYTSSCLTSYLPWTYELDNLYTLVRSINGYS